MQRDGPRNQPLGNDGASPSSGMVGDAPAFRKMLDRLLTAAGSEAPVLLQGETGTGKELAADFIHRHSARHAGPFQTIDCSVLTGQLFESEVFGHERGAFTGNVGEKRGLFELADGGTLFLDEIGEMPLALQAKLLRVLESGEFRRLGGNKNRRVNVRLICASNRELLGAPEFRSDLYYRVACLSIRLPGLRERASDIPLLTAESPAGIGRSAGRAYSIDPSALALLLDHDFPGNVRELRNILWMAAVNTPDGCIGPAQVAAALPVPVQGINLERGREKAQVAPRPREERRGACLCATCGTPTIWPLVLRRHHGNRRAVSPGTRGQRADHLPQASGARAQLTAAPAPPGSGMRARAEAVVTAANRTTGRCPSRPGRQRFSGTSSTTRWVSH